MKIKIINLVLIVTSLIGYLEWGGGNSTFLYAAEAEIIFKLFKNPGEYLHPLILLPLVGQILLIVTLFQKAPSRILSYSGVVCLSLLLIFMFIIGIISLNLKVVSFSTPFLIAAFFAFYNYRLIKS